ncbi:exonuclease SbcCD subunit D [Vagococcus coleopterorum]|uniref:Nuclease SbcCD subunit D n=1 Tax=Vagococcus coleopterorum TaxID=2714946 RepID=A0A6G8AMQ7_9ENTE|nr:exonuclease SbcCD subunit D [Vagococcus coleopterorum]QIL46232.1 exonuclease SbcCD subunit D [Vagococcus coleopterorum]
MKLLHTADWHIGKQLNGFDLLDEQWHAFETIRQIAKDEKVDGIIIAGDLYDRAIPSVAAVEAFDKMLHILNIEDGLPVYAISGNHDGANRLNFGNRWFEENQLYLRTQISEAFQPVELNDVQIFMLPFFDPIDARIYFDIDEPSDLRSIDSAIALVIDRMKEQFNPSKKQILITHFHVTGEQNADYELTSETTSTVGGLNAVRATHFKDFDYVALGHLHLWQASPDKYVRYSGSPVKFNTKEATNEKGVYIVEITEKGVTSDFRKITPKNDLIVLKGTFDELMSKDFSSKQPKKGEAFFSVKLTDRPLVKNIRQSLSEVYGDVVELHFMGQSTVGTWDEEELSQRTVASDQDILKQFYEDVTAGQEMSLQQINLVEDVLQEVRKAGEEA